MIWKFSSYRKLALTAFLSMYVRIYHFSLFFMYTRKKSISAAVILRLTKRINTESNTDRQCSYIFFSCTLFILLALWFLLSWNDNFFYASTMIFTVRTIFLVFQRKSYNTPMQGSVIRPMIGQARNVGYRQWTDDRSRLG